MPDLREELGREEHEAAQRGFERLLRRKRFSPNFVDRHAADLLAKARLEYSQQVAEGDEVRNPVGWIIHCAWRRTQNLLEQKGRAPRVLSIEGGGAFADESATPEEEVLSADRYRQLQAALDQLPHEERKVIALTYFEGMSVREVGRTLRWDKCKADRRHRAALERLQELLGVSDVDALQIEIGILAWASLGAGVGSRSRLPAGIETVLDGIAQAAARGQELARRVLAGGAAEPGMAPAMGGAARTAGVCGAAAAACLATGLLGPGVGGIDVLGGQHHRKPAAERPASPASTEEAASSTEVAQPAPSVAEGSAKATASHRAGQGGSKTRTARRQKTDTTASAASATPQQVEEEFGSFAGGGEGSSSGSGASASSTSSSAGSSTGSSSPPPAAASGKQVESEFGP